ncbi:MAG: hypothetical protein IJQ52_02040 [Bacteroidales bacterium]|nr:hypothetical protein [Bacteroidales bacterium]
MAMKFLYRIAVAATFLSAVFTGVSCSKDTPASNDNRHVVVLYSAGFNNLSTSLNRNIMSLKNGYVPTKGTGKPVLLVVSKSVNNGKYENPAPPCMIQVYKKGKDVILDTVKTYSPTMVLANPESLRTILLDIKEMYPAKGYGMVFSSHSTGWLPKRYYDHPENYGDYYDNDNIDVWGAPAARPSSIGAEYGYDEEGNFSNKIINEIDSEDFASAIPYRLDYIAMDACLGGCVEVAYSLRTVTDYYLSSPAEILTTGFDYDKISQRLLKEYSPMMVCDDYLTYYQTVASTKSATISMVDTRKLGQLADVCRRLNESYSDAIAELDQNAVQGFSNDRKPWYYDLRDIYQQAGISYSDYEALENALAACIIYEGHTSRYYSGGSMHDIRTCCGLTMFLPQSGGNYLKSFYKTLAWNQATGLIQ